MGIPQLRKLSEYRLPVNIHQIPFYRTAVLEFNALHCTAQNSQLSSMALGQARPAIARSLFFCTHKEYPFRRITACPFANPWFRQARVVEYCYKFRVNCLCQSNLYMQYRLQAMNTLLVAKFRVNAPSMFMLTRYRLSINGNRITASRKEINEYYIHNLLLPLFTLFVQ